ncbi:hypothetical protein BD626DRAFT_607478 [Schizophyllum amplum]|uniref:MYND-type domain-containing protein n=1 Tax=Schizophyllum amplum TaxID=97359 RepID=A0A550C467_9AGAR|nr:hypothetical protein BD626DRAFT_607478 [Auriculariopsis ampla]
MSAPITVIPTAPSECEICGEPEGRDVQLLRCSTCKDRFYCSTLCQKIDWKQHKKNCSLLPVPLVPIPVSPSAELTAEVERAGAALERVADAWHYDETIPSAEKNGAKLQHATFKSLAGYEVAPPFNWKSTQLNKMAAPNRTLHVFMRLYWMDTVSRVQTDASRREWLTTLKDTPVSEYLMTIVPEKALARPGELSIGEYEALQQLVGSSSFPRRVRRGTIDASPEDGRWLSLALIHMQTVRPCLLDYVT